MVQTMTFRATSIMALVGALLAAVVAGVAVPAAADEHNAPQAGLSQEQWREWAEAGAAEAAATDWAALSAAAGCTLVSVTTRAVVDPVANAERGAPTDLAVTVVERAEDCSEVNSTGAMTLSGQARTANGLESATNGFAAASGANCASTSGPGTLCLGRYGSYLTTSFTYNGSSTISAFLKIYSISRTSGCPTGTTLSTGAMNSYTQGLRRSLSVYAPTTDTYSAHIWKRVGPGFNTDWGGTCGTY